MFVGERVAAQAVLGLAYPMTVLTVDRRRIQRLMVGVTRRFRPLVKTRN